jgi:hypothetical protein
MIQFNELIQFQTPLVSAASGLILAHDRFFFVSDDELSLNWVHRSLNSGIQRLPLFPGSISSNAQERKRQKPDLESLVYLSEFDSLLCVPSGSTPVRNRGALVSSGLEVRELSFEPLYSGLRREVPELNIEGAVVMEDHLFLFQRGNGPAGVNAVIQCDLRELLFGNAPDFEVTEVHLGQHEGVSLGFTDACVFQDSIWFLAAAENVKSTFSDGEFCGAVLGRLDSELKPNFCVQLDLPFKPEGLVIDRNEVYVVTDADDPATPSRLYRGLLPGNIHSSR